MFIVKAWSNSIHFYLEKRH